MNNSLETTNFKKDKIARYKWICHDKPGTFQLINKSDLLIESKYQRDLNTSKVLEIASSWSWVACGTIIVAKRNEAYWAVDGQHRIAAALRRSDIQLLPCMIYSSEGVADEATSFLRVNTNRKPIDSFARHKARLAANDENALFVESAIKSCGLEVASNSKRPLTIHCIGWCSKRARENREVFSRVLSLVAEMAIDANSPKALPEKVLEGFWYIHHNCGTGLNDSKLVERAKTIGLERLLNAAIRAGQLYAAGGAKVWAAGMLEEINKGLRYKYTIGI